MTCIILLATKNGESFLVQQLESIKKQSYSNWIIYASDDKSNDNTINILLHYQREWGKSKLRIFQGPAQGYAKNFWSLLHRVRRKDIQYIAFCDQDDIWDSEHLSLGIMKMRHFKSPCLYCSRTQYIDKDNNLLDFSPRFLKDPCFQNALVQNIAGGNTQLFNFSLLTILQKIPLNSQIVSHDWTVYQVVTAIGGKVFYNLSPSVMYRQHSMNIIGRNDRIYDQMKRLTMLLSGRFRQWININLHNLQFVHADMTQFNQDVMRRFTKYRDQNLFIKLFKVFRLYLFRQTFKGQIALYLGFLINKL